MPASSDAPVLVIGEVLWDALPRGLFLGGAPFNVAAHLHTLGLDVRFVSRIGDDRLGREVRRRITQRGIGDGLLQIDPTYETGFVEVAVDGAGLPSYTIVQPVAWDHLAWTGSLAEAARVARMVVFGSLAQRNATTRNTLQHVLDTATAATVVFDINLRAPHEDAGVVEASLHRAQVVKLNDDELARLQDWYGLPGGQDAAAETLMDRFGLTTLCVTLGADGAILWHDGERHAHRGHPTTVVDTVGAGDSFLAMLLRGLLAGDDAPLALDRANRLGAFVAGQPGATPAYSYADLFDESSF
ncbi:MAG: carbohydrate kinase [Bacteroidota bacterium]